MYAVASAAQEKLKEKVGESESQVSPPLVLSTF
jgi:hypothetical protein